MSRPSNEIVDWFTNYASKIRWGRLLRKHGLASADLRQGWSHNNSTRVVAWATLGGFIATMEKDGWVQRYIVDLGPTLARWAKEPDRRYHLAEWIVRNDHAALERPFGEVFPELGIT